MISFPNAKINLGLNIVERRADGYHNLETVFYPIGLTDVLEIVPAHGNESTLTTYGLGGGSSDASSTMLMLNEMFNLAIEKEELARHAATLGADCPFFIYNSPMMATGIGDILSPIDVNLKGLHLLLVKPDVSVPTKVAYSRVTPAPSKSELVNDLSTPVIHWQEMVKNDFEPSVFEHYPELAKIKLAIEEGGALYASMSGSGSSIFGIFDDVNMAETLKNKFTNTTSYVIAL